MGRIEQGGAETIDDGPPPMEDHDLYEPPPPPATTHRSTPPPQQFPPPPQEPAVHHFPPPPPQQFPPPPPQDPEVHHFPPQSPQHFPPHEAHHFPPQQFPPTQDPEVHHFPPPSPQQFPPPQDHGVHQFPPPYEDDAPVKPPSQQVMGQVFTPPPQQQTAYQFTPQNQYQQQQNIQNGIPLGVQQNQLPTQPWSSNIFDCMKNPQNALITLFFPCVTFGQIAEIVDSGTTSCGTSGMMYSVILCCIAMPCIMSCTYRSKLRSKYGLVETPAPDWVIHCFCEYCALCQEYRELEERGFDPSIGWLGNVAKQQQKQQQFGMTPPTQQRMF